MESINVAFSTTNGLFSRLVRWFTRSKVSHSLITFRDETLDQVFVMEANGRGFMLVPWSKWKKGNTLVARYSILVPDEVKLASLRHVAGNLGAEYDYLSLFGFLLRRFRSRMKNPMNDSKKLICSEAVAKFLGDIKYGEGALFQDSGSWTPEDLYSELSSNRYFVEEEASSGQ